MNDVGKLHDTASAAVPARPRLPWGRWWSQTLAILRLEVRKGFRRPWGLVLLALAPIFILTLRLMIPGAVDDPSDIAGATTFYAGLYQAFILRVVIFLACVAVFGSLIRRELLDRSLHYYFLSPVRREVLVAAKFLTGLVVSLGLFGLAAVVSFALAYFPHEGAGVRQFLFSGPGLGHLGSYLLVTVLACVGYGSVFLFFGSYFKSPALPALAVFGWESIHFLLPPLLKKVSVIHYLQSLCPVPVSEGPFAVMADAPSRWVAIVGLLLLAVVLVTVSALRVRSMEVKYEEE
jgi:ABC-type transport system involved in multi-copper enzyme maturation permease subunit